MSIYGAIRSTGNPIGSLMLAKGKANWGFWWNFGLFLYVPIGIYISSQWGLLGVSWGLVIIMTSLIIPNWYLLVKNLCNAGFIEYHKEIFVPFIVSFSSAMVTYTFVTCIDNMLIRLILGSIIGLMMIIGLNYIFNRKFLIELKGFRK